ncbi:MAG: nitroreductase family protein [Rikenellaceae bacterium]
MEAIEMIKERRSVRTYKNEKVDRELMKEIIDICRWSPSWANFQIARYTIVDDEAMIQQIYEKGVNGFAYNMATLKNTKGVMVLSYVKGKSGKKDRESYATKKVVEAWEMFDAGIACQTFCLAAHAKGVGTCIFGIIDDEAIADIISLPEGETVAAIVTYGYEDGERPVAPKRKALEEVMRVAGE